MHYIREDGERRLFLCCKGTVSGGSQSDIPQSCNAFQKWSLESALLKMHCPNVLPLCHLLLTKQTQHTTWGLEDERFLGEPAVSSTLWTLLPTNLTKSMSSYLLVLGVPTDYSFFFL